MKVQGHQKRGGPFYTFLNEGQGHQKGALLTPFYLNMNWLQCQFRIIYNYRST